MKKKCNFTHDAEENERGSSKYVAHDRNNQNYLYLSLSFSVIFGWKTISSFYYHNNIRIIIIIIIILITFFNVC